MGIAEKNNGCLTMPSTIPNAKMTIQAIQESRINP